MKEKVVVMVEKDVLAHALRQAQLRGVSLSALVESMLRGLPSTEGPSFVEKWSGRFSLADRDDARFSALTRRLLD